MAIPGGPHTSSLSNLTCRWRPIHSFSCAADCEWFLCASLLRRCAALAEEPTDPAESASTGACPAALCTRDRASVCRGLARATRAASVSELRDFPLSDGAAFVCDLLSRTGDIPAHTRGLAGRSAASRRGLSRRVCTWTLSSCGGCAELPRLGGLVATVDWTQSTRRADDPGRRNFFERLGSQRSVLPSQLST